ncbi:hypothetical protein TASIC1_0004022800 [Trichoderma asperellum]|uniref:Uncharacterized protein n=1 Tax=Trichoderma asperellum TaxID=101201 RepID=A0A6V8QPZ4_TRIAP|nr:hypothetical protein TASIC1_0004022800 [Trichoderma asperellum]
MRAAAARPVDEKPAARSLSQRRPSAKNSVDFCADGEYRGNSLASPAVCCWGERPSNQPQAGWTGLVVDPTVGRVAPIRPLSPLLMSPIHQPLPEIASSPPPSPAEPRLPSSGHHGNNTSFETRGARLPLTAKLKDGLHSSCVSASSQRQARRQTDAHRASVVPVLCVWVASGRWNRLRVASHASPHTAEFSATAVWATSGLGGGKNGTRRILALVSH